jgi:hypothetical protein
MLPEIQGRAYQSIRAARCLDAGADTGNCQLISTPVAPSHPGSCIETSENPPIRRLMNRRERRAQGGTLPEDRGAAVLSSSRTRRRAPTASART